MNSRELDVVRCALRCLAPSLVIRAGGGISQAGVMAAQGILAGLLPQDEARAVLAEPWPEHAPLAEPLTVRDGAVWPR